MTPSSAHRRAAAVARRLLVLAVLVVSALAGSTGPARAADGPPGELSRDGATWTTSIDEALFTPQLAWRPGEVRVSTIFVRNASSEAGDVEIVLDREQVGDATGGYLVLQARLGDQPWAAIDLDADIQRIHADGLRAGVRVPLIMRASLSSSAPQSTTVPADALRLRVTVVSDTPTAPSAAVEPDRSNAHLVLAPVFLVSAVLVALGFLIWRRRGTRRSEDWAG